MLAWSTQLIVANPKLPAGNLRELAAFAKANPADINYATPGATSQAHLLFELWTLQSGAKMQHVPYRGGAPALMAVVTGETQITLVSASIALPQIEAKAVKILATGGPTREPQWPDSPTTAEAGFPDFKARQWVGLFAPADTPDEVVARLNAEINRTAGRQGGAGSGLPNKACRKVAARRRISAPCSKPRSSNGRMSPARRISRCNDARGHGARDRAGSPALHADAESVSRPPSIRIELPLM